MTVCEKYNHATWSEEKLQHEIFLDVWNRFPEFRMRLFAVPNGGFRNVIEASRLKATGTVSGIFDLVLLGTETVFLELKEATKGVFSEAQKKFAGVLDKSGIKWYSIRTPQTFYRLFEKYTGMTTEITKEAPYEVLRKEFDDYLKVAENSAYRLKIWKWLMTGVKDGHNFELKEYVAPENMSTFIQLVKDFIDLKYDAAHGFNLSFTEDFTKLRKDLVHGGC